MWVIPRMCLMLGVLLFALGAALLVVLTEGWVIAVYLCFVAYAFRKGKLSLWKLGTARYATPADLSRAGMLSDKPGFIIGRVEKTRSAFWPVLKTLFDNKTDAKTATTQFIGWFKQGIRQPLAKLVNAVHIAVFAPTGVGKGVSGAIPLLLDNPEAAVVLDFKGELALATAEHRAKHFGHDIVLLDPFDLVSSKLGKRPDSLNVVGCIDGFAQHAMDDCRDLGTAVVPRKGNEGGTAAHFLDAAEIIIAGVSAATVHFGGVSDNCSLQTVRDIIADGGKLQNVIKDMCVSDAWGGMLARLGHSLKHFQDKELNGALTTATRFLRFLDSEAIAANTCGTSFDPTRLLRGKQTIYLIIPPERAAALSGLLRSWVSYFLRLATRQGSGTDNRIHFVLDEISSLGQMEQIGDLLKIGRSYGVRLYLFYQSRGELKKCFPEGEDQTLLSNTTQVYFGVNDLDTARLVSDRIGEHTIRLESGGSNKGTSLSQNHHGDSSSFSTGRNDNWQQQARKLLKPEEVMQLPERTAITFAPGVPPIMSHLVRYYEEPELFDGKGPRGRQAAGIVANSFLFLIMAILQMVVLSDMFDKKHPTNGGSNVRGVGVLRGHQGGWGGRP